jgi:predicted ribosome quality control (RQC) complex YloA/Tae2 family protein
VARELVSRWDELSAHATRRRNLLVINNGEDAMAKKEFTSFDSAAVARELKDTILDSRVSNVYQLDSKTLLLKLHKADSPAFNLVLGAGKRLHLTSYVLDKPVVPPAFCMALRKHLRNGWLTGVEQHEFERVVIFSFSTKQGAFQLVMELFGDGNIILINEKNMILQALNYKRMRDRDILRGGNFTFAPPSARNPFKVTKEELADGLKSFDDTEVVRALVHFLGIGGLYAEESLLRAAVDKTKHCNILLDTEVSALYSGLQGLLSQIADGKLEPCAVVTEKDEYVDVVPFQLKYYETAGFRYQSYGSFNEALDEFYARASVDKNAFVSVKIEELEQETDRLKRIIKSQEKALREAATEAELERQVGDMIYAHSSEVQALLDRFSLNKHVGKPWSMVVSETPAEKARGSKPSAFFESFDHKAMIINVAIDGLTFSLELKKSLFENAAKHYERGKRAKQKVAGATVALEDSLKKLADVDAKIEKARLERAKPIDAFEELAKLKVKRREWFEKFRWFVSSDGFLVVGGKDAVSNEVLIKKYTDENDIVFHADIVGAPFVVVKTSGKEPSETCLREAGEFAAAFSRGWREGFASLDVYWVRPEQLSKAGSPGESVGRGAFVVRGERHWFRGTVLRQCVGAVVDEHGEVRFVGGPLEAIEAKTKVLAVLVPGNLNVKDLVRRVLGVLAAKIAKDVRETVLTASVEEIREYIPYGKGTLLEE